MRANQIQILVLILVLFSCKSEQNEKKTIDSKSQSTELILTNELIEDFSYDERLNPDNPDFEFYRVKEFSIDLNQNQKADSIILYKLKGFENDPGDFRQIKIIMDNGDCWSKTNFDGWVRFDNNYSVPDQIKMQNQLNSDLLLLSDFEEHKIIGLFSWVYASQLGLLTFIEFSTGKPRIMLNKKFDLIRLDSQKIIVKNYKEKLEVQIVENRINLKTQILSKND